MAQVLSIVDAFTDRPFSGNPAGVCLLDESRPDTWLQQVAAEVNLSETAFLTPVDDGFDLRWFTPATEVDLCGHATLASAHVLWEIGLVPPGAEIRFHTRSGLLTALRDGDDIMMDFPAEPPSPIPVPEGLAAALGARPAWVGQNRMDLLVLLEDAASVRSLTPDIAGLARLPARGVIVTAQSDRPAYDIISRCFYPAVGIPEDPVTGSAHCALAPFWAKRLGKDHLTGYQASPRGGTVSMRLAGDHVKLGGSAVTVMRSELLA